MELETTLEFTAPLVREAVAGFWRRTVGPGFVVALILCACTLGYLWLQGDRSWVVGFNAAVLLFGSLFVVSIYFVHYRNSLQKLRDMGLPRATFRARQNEFTVASAAGTSTLPWSSVTQLWRFKNVWLLLFSKAQFMTLPLSCMSEEMKAFVLQRVTESGGKVDG